MISNLAMEQVKAAEADRLNDLLDACLTALARIQRNAGLRTVISTVQGNCFVTVGATDAELRVATPYAQMHETSRGLKKVSAIAIRTSLDES
jgi:hypothetical protein